MVNPNMHTVWSSPFSFIMTLYLIRESTSGLCCSPNVCWIYCFCPTKSMCLRKVHLYREMEEIQLCLKSETNFTSVMQVHVAHVAVEMWVHTSVLLLIISYKLQLTTDNTSIWSWITLSDTSLNWYPWVPY